MIAKKIKYTNFDKPKAYRIGNLVDYIRNPQTTNAHEKIATQEAEISLPIHITDKKQK